MTMVNRLKAGVGLFALASAVVTAYVWGDSSSGRDKKGSSHTTPPPVSPRLAEELAAGKFSRLPVITYTNQAKENLFALQLKPVLDPVPARPRDIVIVVDSSASQAGTAMHLARQITHSVFLNAGQGDRISIWTLNTPAGTKSLSNGLQSTDLMGRGRGQLAAATEKLDQEYPSGAVDLKAGLQKVLKDFDGKASRHQVLLFLGDGESAFEPLTEKDRYALAQQMLDTHVSFFAVPLGARLNPANLNALVSGTGGAIIRVTSDEAKNPDQPLTELLARLNTAFNVPVLVPTKVTLTPGAAEIYPTKLPPLRADQPTLLVGRFEGAIPAKLEATIQGKIGLKETKVIVSEPVPAPAADHFFLTTMLGQWKRSSFKDAPALVRADRALALAYEQTRLVQDELKTQGQWAIGSGNFDAAKELFGAAQKLDPTDPEAKAGLKVVDRFKKGELNIKQFKELQEPKTVLEFERKDGNVVVRRVNLQELAGQDEPAPKAAPAPKAPEGGLDPNELLRQEQARRAVLEQQVRSLVEETMNRARRLLREGDPETARDVVLQQRDSVRGNPDISETLRQRLGTSMELLLREIGTQGARIRQQLAEERERIARARAKILEGDARAAAQEQTRDRVKALVSLMAQARFEDAYREAQVLQQERLSNAEPLLLEAQATYQIGQAAANLREIRELVRIREDRFLLAMMQVEKSHVPYPDEPPVHFPPSKVWRDLLELRKKYSQTDFEAALPPRAQRRLNFLKESLNTSLPLDRPLEAPLKEVIDYLEDVASPAESAKDPSLRVKIIANDAAFKAERGDTFEIADAPVKMPKLTGASLATALRILSAQFNGTYIVRRDYIEITTGTEAIRDKVVRAFDVADLVVPIPNGVAQQALNQNLSVLGQTFSLGGGTAFGFTGAFGGGLNGIGGFGQGGFGGQPNQGGQQQNIGNLFQGQNVNLGVQGGVAGFGGGQLGQFGNLGGQFGFQGGTQESLLIALIVEVIARGEWAQSPGILGGISVTQQGNNTGANDPALDPSNNVLQLDQLNSLGYYQPARALVVRGTSRFHKSQSSRLSKVGMGVGVDRRVAAATPDVIEQVGGAVGPNGPAFVKAEPRKDLLTPQEVAKLAPKDLRKHTDADWDARVVWDKELAKGIKDTGAVVAAVDFLTRFGSFTHMSELLKASLRRGLTPEAWAHEALAMALEMSQGSPEEIERARVSSIDLEPDNAQEYLRAAKAVAVDDPERAMRFCKLAARMQPDMADPYLNAMAFAGEAKKVDSDVTVWAAESILKRDWPIDSLKLHEKAKQHLKTLAERLAKENLLGESEKLQKILDDDKRRDLVIELNWTDGSDGADLDLTVTEPIGTVCSAKSKQTTAGGVLVSDDLLQREWRKASKEHGEVYTASQAFDGTYAIKVERIWGRSLGGKAQVKVTRYKGTPQEQTELHMVEVDKNPMLKISFDGGRRNALATVPPPVSSVANKPEKRDEVVTRLKAMTDPDYGGVSGGFGASGREATGNAYVPERGVPAVGLDYQTRVREAIPGGMEMQVETVISPRANESSLKLRPVFQTASANAQVRLSLIPGSGE